jgi:hypothetical protein
MPQSTGSPSVRAYQAGLPYTDNLSISPTSSLTGWIRQHEWWLAHDASSMLALPIIHHDSLPGVLTLIGRQPFHPRADEQDLLQNLLPKLPSPFVTPLSMP